jgi:hypothetical protein
MGVYPFRKGMEKTAYTADDGTSFVRVFVSFYDNVELG